MASLRGNLVLHFLNDNFSYIDYYKQLRAKFGTIRKHSLPLGYYGVEVSDPEWAKVSLCTLQLYWHVYVALRNYEM